MTKSVYNEINLGFCSLEIYTTEDGIQCARLKNATDKRSSFEAKVGLNWIVVPDRDIYTEKVEE